MGDRLVRKGLTIGIIILFIGAGVYPAIAVKLNTSINAAQDEKSNANAKKIEQLSDLPCDCEKNYKTDWPPQRLCERLAVLFGILWVAKSPLAVLIWYIAYLLGCTPYPYPLY